MRTTRSLAIVTVAAALLALPSLARAAGGPGGAPQGMPLDYTQFYFQPGGGQLDAMYKATGTDRMKDADKYMSTYRSRVEAEGKVEIARQDITKAIGQLDKLAADPKLATKVLGKGWRVVKVGAWDFNDVYRDNKSFDLAKASSGYRVRVVNGGKAEVNVKPPGGRKSSLVGQAIVDLPDGLITRRVEFGTSMHPRASLRAMAGAKSALNTLGWIGKMMKQDPTKFVAPAVLLHQDRTRYVLQKYEGKDAQGNDQWNPLVDLSVDDITATLARGPKASRKSVKFASIEMDLNHPGSGTGLVISTAKWKAPHKPADLRRSEFMKDTAVRDLHTQVPKLLSFIDVQAISAMPKYTAACVRLGVITAPKSRAQRTLSGAEQQSVSRFLKSKGWTTNAQVKVIGQSRSGNSWRLAVTNTNGGGSRKLYLSKQTGQIFATQQPGKAKAPAVQQQPTLTGRQNADFAAGFRAARNGWRTEAARHVQGPYTFAQRYQIVRAREQAGTRNSGLRLRTR